MSCYNLLQSVLNHFFSHFFTVILWLLLRHAPPHCQHKPLSWADCRPDSSGNLSPGYLDAPQLMGFKLLSACFSTKNPDETDCQWKQCHILPHVHYLQHWCFLPENCEFSGIGWNSILRKACENASDPVWLTEHPTCFTRLLAQGTDAKIWRKAQMASGCHPFTRHAKIQ